MYIIPTVVRALEIVTKKLDEWLEKLGIKVKVEMLQKHQGTFDVWL